MSPTVLHGLQAVSGLRFGRSNARETEPIKPVADEHILAILPFVSRQVRAMIQLQRLTGMRPGEVVLLRPCDIDQSSDIWTYEPHDHKNRWRGHRRIVPLGPRAQAVLAPFLARPSQDYCFSPREAEQERNLLRRSNRRSPMTPSQAKRRQKVTPKRAKGIRYDSNAYRRAIAYGIRKANKKRAAASLKVPNWCPLQIRHATATEVRKRFGLEGTQAALGHKNANVTQIYAELDLSLARTIAKELG